jgi:hypothetical protein
VPHVVTNTEEIDRRLDEALERVADLEHMLGVALGRMNGVEIAGLVIMREVAEDSVKAWIVDDAGEHVLYMCWQRLDCVGPIEVGARVHVRVNVEPATEDRLRAAEGR